MVILPSIRRKYMTSRLPAGATVQMSECVVTLASDSVAYTGSARTVGVTVTWQGATLAVNTDYTLSWANNVNVGPATVTVTGIGQFSGAETKTFYVTAAPARDGWDGIDLSVMSATPVLETTLRPSGTAIDVPGRNMNISPDYPGHIFFGTGNSGVFCDWEFTDENYDLSTIGSEEHRKKSGLVSNAYSCTIGDSGTRMYFDNGNTVLWATLSTPYDISTAVYQGDVGVTPSSRAYFMAFSADGKKFFYKAGSGASTIYCMNLATAFRFNTFVNEDSFNLNSMFGYSNVYGVCIEPNGENAVVGIVSSGKARLVRLSMSTPFDLSSAVVASTSADLASDTPLGVILDSDGQRALVWYATSKKLCEYSLL